MSKHSATRTHALIIAVAEFRCCYDDLHPGTFYCFVAPKPTPRDTRVAIISFSPLGQGNNDNVTLLQLPQGKDGPSLAVLAPPPCARAPCLAQKIHSDSYHYMDMCPGSVRNISCMGRYLCQLGYRRLARPKDAALLHAHAATGGTKHRALRDVPHQTCCRWPLDRHDGSDHRERSAHVGHWPGPCEPSSCGGQALSAGPI